MEPKEKITHVRKTMQRTGWLVRTKDIPVNPYSVTGIIFDRMGGPVMLHVFSDMQGRVSATLSRGDTGIDLSDEILETLDAVNVAKRS